LLLLLGDAENESDEDDGANAESRDMPRSRPSSSSSSSFSSLSSSSCCTEEDEATSTDDDSSKDAVDGDAGNS
jgi:hypothetical protein